MRTARSLQQRDRHRPTSALAARPITLRLVGKPTTSELVRPVCSGTEGYFGSGSGTARRPGPRPAHTRPCRFGRVRLMRSVPVTWFSVCVGVVEEPTVGSNLRAAEHAGKMVIDQQTCRELPTAANSDLVEQGPQVVGDGVG